MKTTDVRTPRVRRATLLLAVLGAMGPMVSQAANSLAVSTAASPPSMTVFVTNQVRQVITNVIEVRVPTNVFLDLYRTNWVEQFQTNLIEVYRTNWAQRTLTNTVVVERTRTNWVYAYQTNVKIFTRTNSGVSTVSKIDAAAQAPAPSRAVTAAPTKPETKPEAAASAKPAGRPEDLRIELTSTGKPTSKNQMAVQLALKSVNTLSAMPQVQEWRLSRADGTVFMFGRQPQLTAELPLGTYTVTVRARADENHLAVCVSNMVEITREGVVQRTPVAVLAALD